MPKGEGQVLKNKLPFGTQVADEPVTAYPPQTLI